MAVVTGDLLMLNRLETTQHAVGGVVFIRHNGETIGTGEVTDDDNFTIEIPDGVVGEIEIRLGMHNAAPTYAESDGGDLHVALFYSNVNNYFA